MSCGEHANPDSAKFWIYLFLALGLVCISGLMAGLTLGLMSLSLVDLEVLKRSGTPRQIKHATRILPLVKRQHLLLVTLLICNSAAMEALPIFLDQLTTPVLAIVFSVTLILFFGEIIPQSICSRYGLAIGASMYWFVWALIALTFPISYPVSKVLDYILGSKDEGFFRRAELKTLVTLHKIDEGKGGELTHDETTIIAGALEMVGKTAGEAMTPMNKTFAIDIRGNLDWEVMSKVQAMGHSRIPVFYERAANLIGVLLVKDLLAIRPEDAIPIEKLPIRKIPRIPESMPLFDLLNEFQKGHSHMAVVYKLKPNAEEPPPAMVTSASQVKIHAAETDNDEDSQHSPTGMLCIRRKSKGHKDDESDKSSIPSTPDKADVSIPMESWESQMEGGFQKLPPVNAQQFTEEAASDSEMDTARRHLAVAGTLGGTLTPLEGEKGRPSVLRPIVGSAIAEEETRRKKIEQEKITDIGSEVAAWTERTDQEVVGIITLEDVIEELLQEEILDETDKYIDVANSIPVAVKTPIAFSRRVVMKRSFSESKIAKSSQMGMPGVSPRPPRNGADEAAPSPRNEGSHTIQVNEISIHDKKS